MTEKPVFDLRSTIADVRRLPVLLSTGTVQISAMERDQLCAAAESWADAAPKKPGTYLTPVWDVTWVLPVRGGWQPCCHTLLTRDDAKQYALELSQRCATVPSCVNISGPRLQEMPVDERQPAEPADHVVLCCHRNGKVTLALGMAEARMTKAGADEAVRQWSKVYYPDQRYVAVQVPS